MSETQQPSTKDRLIGAMIDLVRQKGFAETRVDDICARVGVSKGAFFHHFASKEAIAIAASAAWCDGANGLFASSLAEHSDPVDFLLAYLDMRIGLMTGETWTYTCYAGTLVAEVWQSHPDVGSAAAASVNGHIDWLTPHVAAALRQTDAHEISTLIQTTIQGALVMAKVDGGPDRAKAAMRHLKSYISTLISKDTA